MTHDDIDWGNSEAEFFECFAAPGELAALTKLAHRIINRANDFEALTDGLFVLADAMESTGHDARRVRAGIQDAASIVDAWRALAELSPEEVDRVVAFARRSSGG